MTKGATTTTASSSVPPQAKALKRAEGVCTAWLDGSAESQARQQRRIAAALPRSLSPR